MRRREIKMKVRLRATLPSQATILYRLNVAASQLRTEAVSAAVCKLSMEDVGDWRAQREDSPVHISLSIRVRAKKPQ